MMKLPSTVVQITLVFFLSTGLANAAQFPNIQAENLNQVKMTLPGDFNAQRSIILVAYKQEHQEAVNTWLPFVQKAARKPGVKYFEAPVLSSAYRLMSGFINNGMRSGITDTAIRDKTITIYTNVVKFNAGIGVTGTDSIHVVVINRSGKVLAHASGAYTDVKARKLRAALGS